MLPRLSTALAALLAAALLTCGSAAASTTQESIIQEDTQLLERDPAARAAALDDIQSLGADVIRVNILWNRIAPAPTARRAPRGFDGADPAAYPLEHWDRYDDLVREASARGLTLMFTPTAPIPRWASPCRGQTAKAMLACKPNAKRFGAFVRALGTRYSGTYADENQGGGVLPRVGRWSIWNEPNQPGWLFPQYERRRGRVLATAAHRYRTLARQAIAALRATGHRSDQILLGETAPLGKAGGGLSRRAIAPVTFLRELFCLTGSGRRLRGSAARLRGCARFSRLAVTGYAHHPYGRGAAVAPTAGSPRDWITSASVRRLTRLLDQAARARRVPSRLPVHYTEYGVQSRPEDPLLGVSHRTQAAWMNQADYMAYRNRRVRAVSQYKLNDDQATGGFQTGLRTWDGRRKAAWDAYRLPIHVVRSGSRARVYGQLRPAAARSPERVEVQWRGSRKKPWRVLATRTVRSTYGHFTTRVRKRSGEFRLAWREEYSRTARAARR